MGGRGTIQVYAAEPNLSDVHVSDVPYKGRFSVAAYTREIESGKELSAYSVGDDFVNGWWLGGADFQTLRRVEEIEPEGNFSFTVGYVREVASIIDRSFALSALTSLMRHDAPRYDDTYRLVPTTMQTTV